MEIIQATGKDLIEILYLLKVCIIDMNRKGFRHWNSAYPDTDSVRDDLAAGRVFLLKDNGVCKGMLTISAEEPAEYKSINWPDTGSKPLYLHRMAIHPKWQGIGLAKMLIAFADVHARENGYTALRLDVFSPSENARQLYEKQDFREIGAFHADYQLQPYICYEKPITT